QDPRGNRSCPTPLEDPALSLRSDRDHEVDERRGNHAERRQTGDEVRRGLYVLRAYSVIPEYADEDDQEQQRQDQREEASLPVAEDPEQVVARLVEDQHEWSASRSGRHGSLRVSSR